MLVRNYYDQVKAVDGISSEPKKKKKKGDLVF